MMILLLALQTSQTVVQWNVTVKPPAAGALWPHSYNQSEVIKAAFLSDLTTLDLGSFPPTMWEVGCDSLAQVQSDHPTP